MEENAGQEQGQGVEVTQELIDIFKDEFTEDNSGAGLGGEIQGIINRAIGDAVHKVFETGDNALKGQDLPGLAKNDNELRLQSDLSVIVGKRKLPASVFDNSPELLLGLIMGGNLINNLLAYQRKQKAAESGNRQPEPEKKQSENDS